MMSVQYIVLHSMLILAHCFDSLLLIHGFLFFKYIFSFTCDVYSLTEHTI